MKVLVSYPAEIGLGDGRGYCRVFRRLGHEVHEVNAAASFRGLGIPGDVSRGYPAEITVEELFGEEGAPGLFFYTEPLGLIPRGLERCPAAPRIQLRMGLTQR